MLLEGDNEVVKLCAEGIMLEGERDKATQLYERAWEAANNDAEFMIAAHYMARVQNDEFETLRWNLLSLHHAEAVPDEEVKSYLPSLYLNIAKSYEDLHNKEESIINYRLAQQYVRFLKNDGYGQLISKGIKAGIERVTAG